MKDQNDWPGESYLERVHLDASKGVMRQEEKFGVSITTTARLGHGGTKRLFSLQKGFNPLQVVKERPDGGAARFEWLHAQAKSVFSRVLAEEARNSIHLWTK